MAASDQGNVEDALAFLKNMEESSRAEPSKPAAQPSRPAESRGKPGDDRDAEVASFLQGLGGQADEAKPVAKKSAPPVIAASTAKPVTIRPDDVPVAYAPPASSKPVVQSGPPEPYELLDRDAAAAAQEAPGENSKRIREEKSQNTPFADAAVAAARRDIEFWVKAASKWSKDNLNNGVPLTREQVNSMARSFAHEFVEKQARENGQKR